MGRLPGWLVAHVANNFSGRTGVSKGTLSKWKKDSTSVYYRLAELGLGKEEAILLAKLALIKMPARVRSTIWDKYGCEVLGIIMSGHNNVCHKGG